MNIAFASVVLLIVGVAALGLLALVVAVLLLLSSGRVPSRVAVARPNPGGER